MRRLILDTNVLCSTWHGKLPRTVRVVDIKTARQSAQSLKQFYEDAFIVTPVKIEMLCGVRNAQELQITRVFLDEFEVIDAGLISKEDWIKAEQYAARSPRDGKPRDFADCLIRAIADRYHAELVTFDQGVPQALGNRRS